MSIEHLREFFDDLLNPSGKDPGRRASESFRILADELIKMEAIDFRSDFRGEFLRIQSRVNALRQRGSFTVTQARESVEGLERMFETFVGDADSLDSSAYKGLTKLNIKLDEKIGSGFFGVIFRGRDPDLERDVAVKVIKPNRNAPDAIEHAKDLAKAGPHPNIVAIHNVGLLYIEHFKQELPVAVMEWMAGNNLVERTRDPLFTKEQVKKICFGIISGMQQLHSCGVAHGDMHFENIFIKPDHTAVIIDVDSTRDNTLSRISTSARADIVFRDVTDCRKAIVEVFTHSEFDFGQTNALDRRLKVTTTIEEIKETLCTVIDSANEPSRRVPSVTQEPNLIERVIDFIEVEEKKPSLQRIIVNETKHVCEQLISERFDCNVRPNENNFGSRIQEYEQLTDQLTNVLGVGGLWGTKNNAEVFGRAISSLANIYQELPNQKQGLKPFIHLRALPSMIGFYAAGFAAWLNRNFDLLRHLIFDLEFAEIDSRRRLSTEIYHSIWEITPDWKHYVDKHSTATPVSEFLALKSISAAKRHVSQGNAELDREFDRFEYFLGLVDSFDPSATEHQMPIIGWAPIGRFIWRTNTIRRSDKSFGQSCTQKLDAGQSSFDFLQAGFFDNSLKALKIAIFRYELYCLDAKKKLGIRIQGVGEGA